MSRMVNFLIAPGAVLDGFTIGECVHHGGMATLWSVTHPDIAVPLLMKIPRTSEGEDPAAIVSFEMEQMILPRLSGPHVPKFIAAGDFAVQPYIVMEHIDGPTLLPRLLRLRPPPPLPTKRPKPRKTSSASPTSGKRATSSPAAR